MLDKAKDRFKKELLTSSDEFNKQAAELKQHFNDTAPVMWDTGHQKYVWTCVSCR